MRKILLIILVFAIWGVGLTKTVVPLPELLKPANMFLDDKQIYITEGTSIFIYSLKNHNLIKKFGKEGEGPEEFKVLPQLQLILNVSTENIIVNSFGKVSHFTKTGVFIREEKVKGGFVFFLLPLGDKLAGQGVTQENNIRYRSVNIYDQQLNKVKEIAKVEDNFQGPGQGFRVLHESFAHQTLGNRLYVAKDKDFVIHVYDQDGKTLSPITVSYDLIPMTQEKKDEIVEFVETDPSTKAFSELLKPLRFPPTFPAVFTMFAADDKLYVMTWNRKDGKNEIFSFDPDGQLLETSFVPMKYQNALLPSPFAIQNGKFYQVVENEDTEEWELHIIDLK
jgi:hypothetical protein